MYNRNYIPYSVNTCRGSVIQTLYLLFISNVSHLIYTDRCHRHGCKCIGTTLVPGHQQKSCCFDRDYIDGLVQDCSNSSALAMELLQSCAKPSISSLQNSHTGAIAIQQTKFKRKKQVDNHLLSFLFGGSQGKAPKCNQSLATGQVVWVETQAPQQTRLREHRRIV